MSTPISQSRADLAPILAERYRNILQDLGEDSEREGLLDTPLRAAKALLFFTKVNEYVIYNMINGRFYFINIS